MARDQEDAGAGLLALTPWQPPEGRMGMRVVGEIDASVLDTWRRALATLTAEDTDVHLDMSELTFICARSTSVLVAASERLPEGRRVVLHDPPVILRRIMTVLWPEGVPSIELVPR